MTFIQKLLGRASEPDIDLGPIVPDEPAMPPVSRLDRTRGHIARSLDMLRGQRETIIRDLDLARKNFDELATKMNDERREIEMCIKAMEAAEDAVKPMGPTGAVGSHPGPIGVPIMRHENINDDGDAPIHRTPPHLRGIILPDGTEIPDGPAPSDPVRRPTRKTKP